MPALLGKVRTLDKPGVGVFASRIPAHVLDVLEGYKVYSAVALNHEHTFLQYFFDHPLALVTVFGLRGERDLDRTAVYEVNIEYLFQRFFHWGTVLA
jgi:hypothetical protein